MDTMNQQQQQPPQQQQQQPKQQLQPQQQEQKQQPSSQPQMNVDQKRSNEQIDEDDCQSNEGFIVKLRGLTWSTTTDDVIKFISTLGEAKVKDGASGVHFNMTREGKPSGQAYVELESEENLMAALKKDRELMGSRYIDVLPSNRSEMERFIKKNDSTLDRKLYGNCVRIRGLPFNSTKDDIVEFFQGLEMIPGGITIATNFMGRITGEAFVQFVSRENVEKALQKHMEKIRHRYIEVFRSSLAEIRYQARQRRIELTPYYCDPMDRFAICGGGGCGRCMGGPRGIPWYQGMMGSSSGGGGRGGWTCYNWNVLPSRPLYIVHMRGLPFKANEADIATFFEPLEPVGIYILFNNNNRPSGAANVEFCNIGDAEQALSKDHTLMQHRYIELFMVATLNLLGQYNMPGPRPNFNPF